ncbi:helix-turn-helix domain-containing protein [Lactococcus protaetiae]|uniref:Helix-turn-helix transcriptional regulator n=1 Tax=Lactococcus protaetiae TaxID=2592653 RepID=A0A514Z6G7_9LACT|nr:helix-turn-helix transcriptional regulator [Lactococcus protaetiae]QDK70182.1 helix-turn-helix transcriptional regulator [Lactococcus protaetiae]
MFYERLKSLANEKKKSLNQIENDLGFSKNTLYNSKKYTPQGDKLAKLAEYFGVSIDYLLGKKDTRDNEPLTEEENELIAAFRMEREDMTPDEQIQFNKALKDLMKYAKDTLNDDSKWKK